MNTMRQKKTVHRVVALLLKADSLQDIEDSARRLSASSSSAPSSACQVLRGPHFWCGLPLSSSRLRWLTPRSRRLTGKKRKQQQQKSNRRNHFPPQFFGFGEKKKKNQPRKRNFEKKKNRILSPLNLKEMEKKKRMTDHVILRHGLLLVTPRRLRCTVQHKR